MKEKDRRRIIKETEERLCETDCVLGALTEPMKTCLSVLSGPAGALSEELQ